MRHQAEPLPQLGFLLGLALRDLVAEHRAPDGEPLEPVAQPVDGEGLGRPAGADMA